MPAVDTAFDAEASPRSLTPQSARDPVRERVALRRSSTVCSSPCPRRRHRVQAPPPRVPRRQPCAGRGPRRRRDARSGGCGGGTDDSDDSLEGHPVSVSGVAARPQAQPSSAASSSRSAPRRGGSTCDWILADGRPPTGCLARPHSSPPPAAPHTPLLKAAVRACSLTTHRRATDELVRLGAAKPITLLGSRVPEIAAAVASSIGARRAIPAHRATIAASRGVAMLLRCLGGGPGAACGAGVLALRILALEESVRETLADAAALVPVVAVLAAATRGTGAAAGLLGSVAAHPSGRRACLDAGAVPPLVKLLPLRHEPTQAAARAIKNLAFTPDGALQVTRPVARSPSSECSEWLRTAASRRLRGPQYSPWRPRSFEELLASVM